MWREPTPDPQWANLIQSVSSIRTQHPLLVPQSNGKVNYTVSGDNALGLSSAERSSPLIPKKNPTRSSLNARVKSYLFHLYWNEAGPFNKTDVAVISSDSTTRANDALLLCYLNTERVLGWCELRPVWLFRREPVDSRSARVSRRIRARLHFSFKLSYVKLLPPACFSNSPYRSEARRPLWMPHVQYLSTIKIEKHFEIRGTF